MSAWGERNRTVSGGPSGRRPAWGSTGQDNEQLDESNSYVNPWGRRVPIPAEMQEATSELTEVKRKELAVIAKIAAEYRRVDALSESEARKEAESIARHYLNRIVESGGSSDDYLKNLNTHHSGLQSMAPRRSKVLREIQENTK